MSVHHAASTTRRPSAASTFIAAAALLALAGTPLNARAQGRNGVPDLPPALEAPAGQAVFLVAHAVGTQNYICQSTGTATAWRLFGPQATLFHVVQDHYLQQLGTHFFSGNPAEGGLGRPTWQHPIDSSRVWGRAAASSSDPAFVAAGAVPWLLVEIVGAAPGLLGSGAFTATTFIQRVNTAGGVADPATCADPSRIGATTLVPYEADYVFYRATSGAS